MPGGEPEGGSQPRPGPRRGSGAIPGLRRGAEPEAAPRFGEALRQARRARALTLEDVERETRIPLKYLAALEDQEYSALPSTVYARGVLRAYASYLGLDPQPLLDQFRPPRAREERGTIRPALPLAVDGPAIPWSLLGGVAALLGMVALSAYLYGQYVAFSESLQVPARPATRSALDRPEPLVAPWTPMPWPTPAAPLALVGGEGAAPEASAIVPSAAARPGGEPEVDGAPAGGGAGGPAAPPPGPPLAHSAAGGHRRGARGRAQLAPGLGRWAPGLR
jgi:cytoskeleton protein RodZ